MSFIAAALKHVLVTSVAATFSKAMLKKLLFMAIDAIVKSTKTKLDDEWAKDFKKSYEEAEGK